MIDLHRKSAEAAAHSSMNHADFTLPQSFGVWDKFITEAKMQINQHNQLHQRGIGLTLHSEGVAVDQKFYGVIYHATVSAKLVDLSFAPLPPVIKIRYSSSRSEDQSFEMVLNEDSDVVLEQGGDIVSVTEAVRRVLAPALYGVRIHVPKGLVDQ